MLFAQAPSAPEVEAAKAVATELLSGMKDAAAREPTNYLVIVTIISTLAAAIIVVIVFLRYLRTLGEAQESLHREQRQHLAEVSSLFADRAATSQSACHAHSLALTESHKDDTATLKEAVGELRETTHDLKAAVGSVEKVAERSGSVIELAMAELKGRQAAT